MKRYINKFGDAVITVIPFSHTDGVPDQVAVIYEDAHVSREVEIKNTEDLNAQLKEEGWRELEKIKLIKRRWK